MEGRSFVLGMLAGGGLLLAGVALGGAARATTGPRLTGSIEVDTLRARRVEIVRSTGDLAVQLRTGKDGGLVRVFDRLGDPRAEVSGDGSAMFYCDGGRPLARVGSCINDPALSTLTGAPVTPKGELLVFDAWGTVVGKLPGWIEPTLHQRDDTFAESR